MPETFTKHEAEMLAREAKADAYRYPAFSILDPSSEACRLVEFAQNARRRLRACGFYELAQSI